LGFSFHLLSLNKKAMKNLFTTLMLLCIAAHANAQWSSDTFTNLTVTDLPATNVGGIGTHEGRTYVTFYSNVDSVYFMRVQLLDTNGYKLWGDSGILISETGSSSDTNYNFCVDAGNNLIVGLQYSKSGIQTVIINKITPGGDKPWGVNGVELGAGFIPFPIVLTNGDIVVAWNNGSVINYQKIHSDGSLSWPLPKVVSVSPDSVANPQVVAHTNNTFGIVYQQSFDTSAFTHLYEQRFDSAGNALWTSPAQLSNYGTGIFRNYSRLLAAGDATFMCYSGKPPGENRYDGFLQKINADGSLPWGINGAPFADYSTSIDPYERKIEIARDSSSSVIWAMGTLTDSTEVNSGIFIQKFDAENGTRLLGNNAKTVFAISPSGERQVHFLSLCDDAPLFIFTDITRKLFASKLDTAGNFAWDPIKKEISSTTQQKRNFAFTETYLNQAIAVWQERRDTAFAPYAQNIHCDGSIGGVLPVTLTKFWGNLKDRIVSLFWETKTENNNKGFYIARSTDGINYSNIGFVASKAPFGNSVGVINYTITDPKPFNGNNYYRLEQLDFDGRSTFSNVILIKNNNSFGMRMNNVYPNPVLNVLNIYIESQITDKVTFIISDAAGKIVRQVTTEVRKGNNNFQVNIAGLASGSYFIKLVSKNSYDNTLQHFIKK
jgi:hypothetical protein